MKYRLWNKTIDKWIRNDDGDVCLFDSTGEALDALERVIELSQLNPEHRNDEIVITHAEP